MCKNCMGSGLVSAAATWGFFALLLTLLNVVNASINAIWLTLLIFIATVSCPVLNSKIGQCCAATPKKKKK